GLPRLHGGEGAVEADLLAVADDHAVEHQLARATVEAVRDDAGRLRLARTRELRALVLGLLDGDDRGGDVRTGVLAEVAFARPLGLLRHQDDFDRIHPAADGHAQDDVAAVVVFAGD